MKEYFCIRFHWSCPSLYPKVLIHHSCINLTFKYEIEDLETNYRNKNEKAPFSEIESPITPSEYVKNFERSLKNVINLKSNYESI